MLQDQLPVQAPVQFENIEPESATGVRVTIVPLRKSVEHVDPLLPQEMPPGADSMVHDPVGTTERVYLVGDGVIDPHHPHDDPEVPELHSF
jgi:hypothetical protein